MTSTFGPTGITLDRYADVLARLIALTQEKFGDSINTEEDEFFGHMHVLISVAVAEINEIIQDLYDSDSVSAATGVRLDNQLELVDIERSEAAYSTVTLTLTATAATTVPQGTQYATAADVVFATDEALVFAGAGSQDVTATCTVTGANQAAINEVTVIRTPIYGISAVTNAAAAIPGRDRESDEDLKTAHTVAMSTSGKRDEASVYEALIAVTGVSSAYVFANDSDIAVGVVPARTLHCSVVGGADADVAAAIDGNKIGTVPTHGASTVAVYNTTTRQSKDINFDRAVNTAVHIEITTTTNDLYPDDGDALIKAALVAHFDDIRIADNVVYNALYSPIYSVPGHVVSALKVDTVDPPTGTSDLTSSPTIRYTLATADIDIVKV